MNWRDRQDHNTVDLSDGWPRRESLEEVRTTKHWNFRDIAPLALRIQQLVPRLSYNEAELLVALFVDTCPGCFSDNRSCCCWNDE